MGLDNFEQILREEIRGHIAFDTMTSDALQIVKDQMNMVMEQVGNSLSVITGDILWAVNDIRSSVSSIIK